MPDTSAGVPTGASPDGVDPPPVEVSASFSGGLQGSLSATVVTGPAPPPPPTLAERAWPWLMRLWPVIEGVLEAGRAFRIVSRRSPTRLFRLGEPGSAAGTVTNGGEIDRYS